MSYQHDGSEDLPREAPDEYRDDSQGVAIIGMACRFPDADTPARFWANLVGGRESITVADGPDDGPAGWVRASATLEGIDRFDAGFFGYNPREAALLDPQHRLFLEVCWEALEDGGAAGQHRTPDVGVYGGCGTSLYLMHNLGGQASRPLPNFLDTAQDLQLTMAAERDFLTSRVSYKLDLDGPSVSVQAACATGLYALHLACQALLAGECDLALAGAAHVPVPQIDGYQPEPGLVLSQDGHCRAFDAGATGTVFGSGVGAVLLKPLDRALADGDRVYAVVRGTAVNNDGASKPGFSSPSVAGQAAVIRQALAAADVEADSVSYVEAHGTATPTGDPIEIAALTDAFAGVAPGSCALGSVKTNIGHLSWAAGIAGLIKAALALWHRRLPASLHFHEPNPAIDFAGSPFFVQSETADWPRGDGPRRAGVSAFGVGGTNAHAILEEAPALPGRRNDPDAAAEPGMQVLPISGDTEPALRELASRIGAALLEEAAPEAIDVAFTLGAGRRHFAHRAAVVGSDCKTLAMLLDAVANGEAEASDGLDGEIGLSYGLVRGAPPRLTTLFSGHGAEYLEACRDLYLSEPVFREFIDRADPLYRQHIGHRLSEFLYQDDARRGMPIDDFRLAQPVVYTLQAALLTLWRSWGVTPDAYAGHSLGEYAAAYGAGVFDFETGLYLVSERARLFSTLPESGAMAAVFTGEQQVRELLAGNEQVGVAAINAPNRTVISGDGAAVRAVIAEAERRGITCKPLRIGRAGHSSQVDAILDDYSAVLKSVELHPPAHTIVSTLTGAPVAEEIATPGYWLRQLRQPVRFLDAIRAAASGEPGVFLEIGLANTLAGLTQLALSDDPGCEPTCLETLRWERNDIASTRLALAGAYTAGVAVDWAAVSPGGRTVTLPTYPFQRRRHWVEPTPASGDAAAGRIDGDFRGALDTDVADPADSGAPAQYAVTWIDAPPAAAAPAANRRILLIAPSTGSAADLKLELERLGAEVLVHVLTDDAVTDAARVLTDYRPCTVVNAVPVLRKRQADLGGPPLVTGSASDDIVAAGGAAGLQLFQAVSAANLPDLVVCTVTSGAHRILTSDDVIPAQGAIVGIARTARTEFSTVRHVLIDLDAAATKQRWSATAVPRLAAAIGSLPAGDAELALRGDRVLLPRLRPGRVPPGAGRVRIDPAAWYLVIGGSAGVGLECAHALLELGARRLVLCGRSAPGPERAERLRRLSREFGADIRTETVDVSSPRQVDRLFARYCAGDAVVRGVVHAAGVIDDGIIDRTDWSRIARVLAPKAQGAWNLHRSAAEYAPDLDLFVMTSSFTGLFGNPGQAGHAAACAFLDALAGHRRAVGLTGLSVNLGSWSDVGYLAGNEDFLRQLEEQGIGTISSAAGRPALRAAIEGRPSGQVGLLPVRWKDLDPDHHLASNPLVAELTGADSAPAAADPPPAAPVTSEDVLACCQEVVARELGFDGDELLGLNLTKAGMDSLNALTIRNKLQRRLSVPLPASICFDKPTIDELADDIAQRMRKVRA
ncbi:type I polyketide synthase [Microbispora sp. H10885]|uniref:type I polyketide synthase n=1 Tax=Microbispora sp. H10885 TaxID=2729110 RepID=UPI001601E586|nr:type I polyketide synthase [Microbispora sp. H10885]